MDRLAALALVALGQSGSGQLAAVVVNPLHINPQLALPRIKIPQEYSCYFLQHTQDSLTFVWGNLGESNRGNQK